MRVVTLIGDKLAVSAQNRVGSGKWVPILCELLAFQRLAFDSQGTSLYIGQQDLLLAERLFENGIVGAKVLNDFLLLTLELTGKNDQHQLPRLQNELHRRLRGVDQSKTIIGAKKAVSASLRRIGVGVRSGEIDCGNIGEAQVGLLLAEMPAMRTLEALLLTFLAHG